MKLTHLSPVQNLFIQSYTQVYIHKFLRNSQEDQVDDHNKGALKLTGDNLKVVLK